MAAGGFVHASSLFVFWFSLVFPFRHGTRLMIVSTQASGAG
jgi:hypothetical protein